MQSEVVYVEYSSSLQDYLMKLCFYHLVTYLTIRGHLFEKQTDYDGKSRRPSSAAAPDSHRGNAGAYGL